VADDIRSLTATLARDPTSLVYVDLADALRRRGQRDEALRVVLHGLARHPEHADGHDALARIYVDLGDLERARLAWDQTLQIAPDHAAALRGMGFVLFRQGQAAAAAAALERALALDPGDAAARRALETVRAAAPEVFVASVPPPPPSPVPPPGSAPPAPAPTAGPSPAGPGPGRPISCCSTSVAWSWREGSRMAAAPTSR
jgi:tetratricopeptide (TPR) repeat protein